MLKLNLTSLWRVANLYRANYVITSFSREDKKKV